MVWFCAIGFTWGHRAYGTASTQIWNPSVDVQKKGTAHWPAFAAGGFNFGTRRGVTDFNMLYCTAGKTLPVIGRLTFGYYQGMNERLFPDSHQEEADTGIIASWDRTLTGKIWACVDYASGNSWYGSLSFGESYAFSPDISVIFGYVVFNDDWVVRNNVFTTQLDITL